MLIKERMHKNLTIIKLRLGFDGTLVYQTVFGQSQDERIP